jgi:pyruvate dehydrogenase E2 component (dihydrolipoamide acetyltransferase)
MLCAYASNVSDHSRLSSSHLTILSTTAPAVPFGQIDTPALSSAKVVSTSTATPSISLSHLTPLFMAEGSKITMPALSSTMKEGRVVQWLKSEGDAIKAGEAIMMVESDKADMDVEAFEDGFLAKIIVQEGEMAPVGEVVALMCENKADIDSVIASFRSGGAAIAAVATETTAATAKVAAPVITGE